MLYHTQLGMPKTIKLPTGRKRVIFTHHAIDQAQHDRYGDFSLFLSLHNSFDPRSAELVEVETTDNVHVNKAVYRIPLKPNDNRELVLALVPYSDRYVAKTVWLNRIDDRHKTLNLRRYDRP